MPTLNLAGSYGRNVRASAARVWENVFDWEHLPSLHDASFSTVELVSQDETGWRIRVVNQPADPARAQLLQLEADRSSGRYQVTTLEGPGRGSRIDTRLDVRGPHLTAITVEFRVAEQDPQRLAAIGRRYAEVYARLWDEDEAMMMAREAALSRRQAERTPSPASLDLGARSDLFTRLPLVFEFGSGRFRLVDLDGDLVAHSIECPHWLGPLDEAKVVGGVVACPWHGYRFDVRTGCSVDGRGLSLATAPCIVLREGRVHAEAAV